MIFPLKPPFMVGIFHGYVTNKQMVCIYIYRHPLYYTHDMVRLATDGVLDVLSSSEVAGLTEGPSSVDGLMGRVL